MLLFHFILILSLMFPDDLWQVTQFSVHFPLCSSKYFLFLLIANKYHTKCLLPSFIHRFIFRLIRIKYILNATSCPLYFLISTWIPNWHHKFKLSKIYSKTSPSITLIFKWKVVPILWNDTSKYLVFQTVNLKS